MKIITLLLMAVIFFITPIKTLAQEQQSREQLEEKTSVYPVPAKSTDDVKLAFAQPVLVSSVRLVRSDGWEPNGEWSNPLQNQQLATLTLPKLSSGFYVLKITLNDGRVFSKKIVINK